MNTDKVCFQKTCDYIDKHLDKKLTLDELCQIEHLSKYHFHRLFHLEVGLPVFQYIQLQRMKKSANQVYFHHHLSITYIALDAGFENTESFSRAFKKIFLVTPTQFRKTPNWAPISENRTRVTSSMGSSIIIDVISFFSSSSAIVIPAGPLPKIITGKFSKSIFSSLSKIINHSHLNTR